MPENLDNIESLTPEPVQAAETVIPPEETKVPEERYVPLSELTTERQARHALEGRLENLTQTQINLQQHLLAMQAQSAPKGTPLDPELAKILDPYLLPYREEIAVTKRELAQNRESLAAQQKFEYVKQNLPELDAIRDKLVAELQSMDADERDAILSSPKALVRLGKTFVGEKERASSEAAKKVARAAGRTETSSTAPSESASSLSETPDWSKMSSEEFNNNPLVKSLGF